VKILLDHTSVDVFQFLFSNFFALALEDPVAYQLTSKNQPDNPSVL